MASKQPAINNRLLDLLPDDVLSRLRPHLEPISLVANQSIQEPGEPADYVFFPTRGLISLVALTSDGDSIEVGMIGNEGMFGVAAVLGDDAPTQRAMVQLPGAALRMPSRMLREQLRVHDEFEAIVHRYVLLTLNTAAQTAACNRLHLLEQRLARWLLLAHDRADGDTFPMTHEFLGMMLGVRRPGVTVAAQTFQADGKIIYNHGTMTILDRKGLEAVSCDCYDYIQSEQARLVGQSAMQTPKT